MFVLVVEMKIINQEKLLAYAEIGDYYKKYIPLLPLPKAS